jgi:hypothetical protein
MAFPSDRRRSRSRRPHAEPDPVERIDPVVLDASAPQSQSRSQSQLLYTPAEAAGLLRVRESWLRRRAAARLVTCTFLGRHLRFSPADLAAIIAQHAEPAVGRRRRRRGSGPAGGSDLMSGPVGSVDASDRDDHHHGDGSGSAWPG